MEYVPTDMGEQVELLSSGASFVRKITRYISGQRSSASQLNECRLNPVLTRYWPSPFAILDFTQLQDCKKARAVGNHPQRSEITCALGGLAGGRWFVRVALRR